MNERNGKDLIWDISGKNIDNTPLYVSIMNILDYATLKDNIINEVGEEYIE